ncbi:hypothetical protein ACIP6X_40155 [Streptomyces coeruleorubidus]|uniref:hypothetical protein n=1 Tax=Streptomyces coeruleorubidus TaxID=116188 RepID=UPI003800868C
MAVDEGPQVSEAGAQPLSFGFRFRQQVQVPAAFVEGRVRFQYGVQVAVGPAGLQVEEAEGRLGAALLGDRRGSRC